MITLKGCLQYLWYIIRHRWFVGGECLKYGLVWQALVHDLSKLSFAEFFPYVKQFYGGTPARDAEGKIISSPEFNRAWLHHQHHNFHHWQSWILHQDSPGAEWGFDAIGDANGPYILTKEEYGEKHAVAYLDDAMVNGHENEVHYQSLKVAKRIAYYMNSQPEVLEMPEKYMLEMIADWRGTGKTLGFPDTLAWYMKNRKHILLHPETRRRVEQELMVPYDERFKVGEL